MIHYFWVLLSLLEQKSVSISRLLGYLIASKCKGKRKWYIYNHSSILSSSLLSKKVPRVPRSYTFSVKLRRCLRDIRSRVGILTRTLSWRRLTVIPAIESWPSTRSRRCDRVRIIGLWYLSRTRWRRRSVVRRLVRLKKKFLRRFLPAVRLRIVDWMSTSRIWIVLL